MSENPIHVQLPAYLPEDWVYGQTVAPNGSEAGMSTQHGYNYLMQQVNNSQKAAKAIGEAFPDLATAEDLEEYVPISQKGKANGVASLGSSGTIPSAQIPTLTSTKLPTVPVSKGGTGKTFWQANRLIYPSTSAAFSQLPYPTEAESVLCQDPSDEPYWMKKGDLLSETASNSDHQLKTYTDLSQIGLTVGSETIESICEALPNASMLIYTVDSQSNAPIYPRYSGSNTTVYGLMQVTRRENTRIDWYYSVKVDADTQAATSYTGFSYYDTTWKWSGWSEHPSIVAVSEVPESTPKGQVTLVYEA